MGACPVDATLTNSSQPVFFSILVDESNDCGVEAKDLVVLVRIFDTTVMRAVTRFLYLPTANDGTAAALFEKIDQILMFCGIKYENFLCFNSDSCWGRHQSEVQTPPRYYPFASSVQT